jgi:hypothetical protein
MNKLSRSILIFCLVTITILASGCGAVTAVPSPTGTPVPSLTPTVTVEPTPLPTKTSTPISEFVWYVIFKNDFDENYWVPGKHSYQIIANCPDTEYFGDVDTNMTFIVDKNAHFFGLGDAVIEFYFNSIGIAYDGYEYYPGSFNPQQKSRLFFGYSGLNLEQANQAIIECRVNAIIDGEKNLELLPEKLIPPKRLYGVYSGWGQ